MTSYQLLQQRFGAAVKTVAAGLFLLTRSLADGIRLFATALVISIVAGVPVSMTIVVLGAAMIWYTMRGGVAAVIWTDVVQMRVRRWCAHHSGGGVAETSWGHERHSPRGVGGWTVHGARLVH